VIEGGGGGTEEYLRNTVNRCRRRQGAVEECLVHISDDCRWFLSFAVRATDSS